MAFLQFSTVPTSPLLLSLFLIWAMLISPGNSLTCSTQTLSGNKLYQHCNDLSSLNSFLHWTYSSSNGTLSFAYLAPPTSSAGWVAWALNPTGTGMAGSQAFIAFKDSNGSMVVNTYNISSYASVMEEKLSVEVYEKSAEYTGGMMRIYATVGVPETAVSSGKLNYIWQVGPSVTDGRPAKHEFQQANLNAKATLDLKSGGSGTASSSGGVDERTRRKNIHGILNAVSWGILFPVGVLIARYLRTFPSADPAWFYLHASCQVSAYSIGVAGWATGLKLGSESKGIVYTGHRNLGIALFSLATIQIFALLIRPKKDHKFRVYWNVYHHGIGYAIVILGIINIFKGLSILDPAKKWKRAYIIALIVMGGLSALLEAITWVVVLRRRSGKSTKPYT
ncbi:hypothetical protein Nepgr_027666 [Nepenthes gracilis]|uniref:Cytochrome b561 and DOMON domain-containing protein n=1 Tax=Nepenthes gracilis TaxID=150966 RepID=A0AAD3TAY9_NEPGR|nr:hypothetical protein Nepgr_027666 [Nepenthes gracilis]